MVGDVHGCLNELRSLVAKAAGEFNDGLPFASVMLVGGSVLQETGIGGGGALRELVCGEGGPR